MTRFATRALAALTLTAALAAPIGGTAETTEYYTLGQLRERTETHWTQTYETPWRTLNVDANIYMPEADSTPVLYARRQDMTNPALRAEESGWSEVEGRKDALILYNDDADETAVPRSKDGRKIKRDMVAGENWYEGFSEQAQYVPMSEITFGEICAKIRGELTRFGFDPNEYAVDAPARLWEQYYEYEGSDECALPGEVLMEIYHAPHGIPVLENAQDAARDPDDKRRVPSADLAPWVNLSLDTGYNAYFGKLTHMFIDRAETIRTLTDDAPLCGFETVRANIEKDIATGRMDKIFDVRFGYLLYDEPVAEREKGETRFYLKPAWIVACRWLDTPQSAPDAHGRDERNANDYYRFAYDAQTGERVFGSSEFAGYLDWNDVK